MFGLGWGEMVVIGVVALIAIGPKELPTVLRTFAQTLAKVRRMAAEFQGQFQEALREAEVADLKKHAEDITSSVTDFTSFDPMANVQKEVEAAFNPETPTVSEPTAEPSPAASLGAPEAPPLPSIEVPLPEPPAPVTSADFAAVEPPPKPAGGGA